LSTAPTRRLPAEFDHRRSGATWAARPLNDTWIAACCIEGGLPLLTLNRRDFGDFAEHDGLVLLDG
jgi:predicted nucleic acid-binding protein